MCLPTVSRIPWLLAAVWSTVGVTKTSWALTQGWFGVWFGVFLGVEYLWQFWRPAPVNLQKWMNRRFELGVSSPNWGHVKEGIGPHSHLVPPLLCSSMEVLKGLEKGAGWFFLDSCAQLTVGVRLWRGFCSAVSGTWQNEGLDEYWE